MLHLLLSHIGEAAVDAVEPIALRHPPAHACGGQLVEARSDGRHAGADPPSHPLDPHVEVMALDG